MGESPKLLWTRVLNHSTAELNSTDRDLKFEEPVAAVPIYVSLLRLCR